MKLYVICIKNGSPYPLGKGGGTAGYVSHECADDIKKAIEKHDSEYCEGRGGLVIDTIEASESLLTFSGFRW